MVVKDRFGSLTVFPGELYSGDSDDKLGETFFGIIWLNNDHSRAGGYDFTGKIDPGSGTLSGTYEIHEGGTGSVEGARALDVRPIVTVGRAGLEPATNGLEIGDARSCPPHLNHVGQQRNPMVRSRTQHNSAIPGDSRSFSPNKRQSMSRFCILNAAMRRGYFGATRARRQ